MEIAHPISEFHLEDTTFSVYRAKAFYSDDWESSDIRDQVAAARESYRIYSPTIPAFDSYDAKSAVYAVRARYPIEYQGEVAYINEWVTLRFVPAYGLPELSEDLKHYITQSVQGSPRLIDQISERLLHSATAECMGRVFTYSRFSAGRPAAENTAQQWVINAYWQAVGIRTKNRWTVVAFALMNSAFLADLAHLNASFPIAITAQINQKVEDTVFKPALQRAGVTDQVAFPYAYDVLGLDSPSAIHLNRAEYNQYFYRFPGYFFSVPQLVSALQALVERNVLEVPTLELYLDTSWESVVAVPSYAQLHRLGELLTITGKVPGLALTGAELRYYLDQSVSDGVQLRLLPQVLVEERCTQLLTQSKKRSHETHS